MAAPAQKPRIDARFKFNCSPKARPESIVTGDKFRFTVIHDGLLRIEYSPENVFEDRASRFALNRDLPTPDFKLVENDAFVEILTKRFHLIYDRKPFTAAGLSVQATGNSSDWKNRWRCGVPMLTNLGSTCETLDGVDGRTALEDGILSRDGIAMLDDSKSFLFAEDGWVEPRREGAIDLYIFAFERDYLEALNIFYAVSGPQPVMPRWALGNHYCRYFDYTEDSFIELMDRFKAERLPFSSGIVDMGWHRVGSVPSEYGTGWTGYSWEKQFFPDPKRFLDKMKNRGLHVALNDHPADGCKAFEDQYPQMAKAMGVDPATKLPINFDIANPQFVENYLKHLIHPLEDIGVDFIWIDWQQGTFSAVPGLEPLFLLNHFHYLDSGRDGRDPFILSRYGGPGSHRYPCGFSGDTIVSWESLKFQPEFTASASNIGYGAWSHDIGAHMNGVQDNELLVRWFEYGIWSPINRIHSSNNEFMVKLPWLFNAITEQAMGKALRFRHQLIPYLYTMNHRTFTDGVPLVCPMYYGSPFDERAYACPNVYYFGSQLICGPITSPNVRTTACGSSKVFLPPHPVGYVDIYTGVAYKGNSEIEMHRKLGETPVLLKAGGVLPLDGTEELNANIAPPCIELRIAPGADGQFNLIEDEGHTEITWNQAKATLSIKGTTHKTLKTRSWNINFIGAKNTTSLSAKMGSQNLKATPSRTGIHYSIVDHPTGEDLTLILDSPPILTTNDLKDRLLEFLIGTQFSHPEKLELWRILNDHSISRAAKLTAILARKLPDAMFSAIAELVSCISSGADL